MSWLINSAYYIIPFIFLLGVLVFVHEFGHFIVARLCKVKVSEFSIGFGKKLWGRIDKHGTEWRIGAIPLGGYCKFLGDEDASSSSGSCEDLSEEDKKYAFALQNPFKKLAIVIAGPGFNYLFAIFIFASIFYFLGKLDFPAVVGHVISGSAAESGGVLVGDKILKVNGIKIKGFSELTQEVSMHTGGDINLEVERKNEIIKLSFPLKALTPKDEPSLKEPSKMMLGVRSISCAEVKHIDMSLGQAVVDAFAETWRITEVTLRGVGQMISGKRDSKEVGGILRIAEMSGDISKKSGWLDFISFMALLSINLGLINLFPIPLLDGGHVVFYTLEIITRRELNDKIKEYIFRFGFFILIALMLFATYNDFVHLFNRWFS